MDGFMDGQNQAPAFQKRGVQTEDLLFSGRNDLYCDAAHELQEASHRACLTSRATFDPSGGESRPSHPRNDVLENITEDGTGNVDEPGSCEMHILLLLSCSHLCSEYW
jgi:hypothetical protein